MLHREQITPLTAMLVVFLVAVGSAIVFGSSPDRRTTLHYAPNGNFSAQGRYLPRDAGFNLADVSNLDQLAKLPDGVKGLVWVGQCAGVDARFLDTVKPFIGNPKVFGFFLVDDPDPRRVVDAMPHRSYCAPENLKAQSDWIHEHAHQAKTVVVLMNLASRLNPDFGNAYNPANSHVDLFGIDPYPCRTEVGGCDIAMIERYVVAAEKSGIPRKRMVPVYQTFGGGDWKNEAGGAYTMPSAQQLREMLSQWGRLIDRPQFDFAYSWGSQRSDTTLQDSPALKELFASRNAEPRSTLNHTD